MMIVIQTGMKPEPCNGIDDENVEEFPSQTLLFASRFEWQTCVFHFQTEIFQQNLLIFWRCIEALVARCSTN